MDPSQLISGAAVGRSRETDIRRDRQGRWWNGVDPIDHPNLVRAFESWIDVADDGRFCLKNDINWAYVEIEGPPVFVRGVEVTAGVATLSLSGGGEDELDPRTLRQGPDDALYCDVRGGRLVARFTRQAAQKLAAVLDEDEAGVYLRLGAGKVRPPTVDDPLKTV